MNLHLWLVEERELARQFSKTPPSPKRDPVLFWVPRSVTGRLLKFREVPGQWRECEADVEDWFVEKEGI